jgi:hypothetical protein
MTENWLEIIGKNIQPPATVDEAIDRLMRVLEDEQKIMLATMSPENLISLHFSLGTTIRNAFGLHNPGSELLKNCGVPHPDDATDLIIRKLWEKLNE